MVWFLLELHYLEQVFMINFIFWNTKIDFSLICNKEFSNIYSNLKFHVIILNQLYIICTNLKTVYLLQGNLDQYISVESIWKGSHVCRMFKKMLTFKKKDS